jgi:ABC-type multidrug transport system fused ATPase/permease subunit
VSESIEQVVWKRQKQWSAAADSLKSSLVFWRTITFVLGISGAFLETLATQVPADSTRRLLAWSGAFCLLLIPILTQRLIRPKRHRAWIRARSASEGLKAEAYRYFAGASPYEDRSKAENVLRKMKNEIEQAVTDLAKHAVIAKIGSVTPPGSLSPEKYLEERVREQIGWYEEKARYNSGRARVFRFIELVLAIAAVALGAAAGVWGEAISLGGWSFTFGAWVAVLTTVGGAMTAHVSASRYDSLFADYSATALRLTDLATQWPPSDGGAAPSPEWSAFVNECENAISVENESWKAKWTRGENKV